MTVPTTSNKNVYNGNGATTVFGYSYKIFVNSDLKVIKTFSDGADVLLVLDTDYSVSGAGSPSGSITYPLSGDPLASGEIITILRVVDITQDTDLRNQGPWNPEVVEDQFDSEVMIAQQQQESIDRSVKTPESELTSIGTLPTVPVRANKILTFDNIGDPVKAEGGPNGGSLISVSDVEAAIDAAGENGFLPIKNVFVGDGFTVTFNLNFTPLGAETLLVYLDDVPREPLVDFSLIGKALTFAVAPLNGVRILVRNFGQAVESATDVFIGNNVTDTFALSFAPQSTDTLLVYLDDVPREPDVDFTTSGSNLIFSTPPGTSVRIVVRNFGAGGSASGVNLDFLYARVIESAPSSTKNAIKASLPFAPPNATPGVHVIVKLAAGHLPNDISAATFQLNAWTPYPMVKNGGEALADSDTVGGDHFLELEFNDTTNEWEYLNPLDSNFRNISGVNTGDANNQVITPSPAVSLLSKDRLIFIQSVGPNSAGGGLERLQVGSSAQLPIRRSSSEVLALGDTGPSGYIGIYKLRDNLGAWTLLNPYKVNAGNYLAKSIANSALVDVATQTVKGRNTAGTGIPEDLSMGTLSTMLGLGDLAFEDFFSGTVGITAFNFVIPIAGGDSVRIQGGSNLISTSPDSWVFATAFAAAPVVVLGGDTALQLENVSTTGFDTRFSTLSIFWYIAIGEA